MNFEKLKISDEYAKLVPPLSQLEYSSLKESMKLDGQLLPIIVNEQGVILDGHHRFQVCHELNIEPTVAIKNFKNTLHEKLFAIDSNLNRRQLSTFARVELALSKKPILQKIAKQRMYSGKKARSDPSQNPDMGIGRVDDTIARNTATSRDTVRKVEFLLKNATAEKLYRLRQGKSRIFREYQQVQEAVTQQKLAKSISSSNSSKNRSKDLFLGDMRQLGKKIPDESIDLIFTDPPYDEKSLYLYDELAKLGQRVLKPGGSLVTVIGHYALPDIINRIKNNSDLEYHWPIVVKHNGHIAKMWKQKVWPKYKPMLWYYKPNNGTNRPTMFEDVADLIESEPPAKDIHKWEQSPIEAAHMIKSLTKERMTVLDPFMGSGTTGIACIKLTRKFIGIEIDEGHYNNARNRLAKLKASNGKHKDNRGNKKC